MHYFGYYVCLILLLGNRVAIYKGLRSYFEPSTDSEESWEMDSGLAICMNQLGKSSLYAYSEISSELRLRGTALRKVHTTYI